MTNMPMKSCDVIHIVTTCCSSLLTLAVCSPPRHGLRHPPPTRNLQARRPAHPALHAYRPARSGVWTPPCLLLVAAARSINLARPLVVATSSVHSVLPGSYPSTPLPLDARRRRELRPLRAPCGSSPPSPVILLAITSSNIN